MAKRRRKLPRGVPKRWSSQTIKQTGSRLNAAVMAEYKERTVNLKVSAWAHFFQQSKTPPPERLKVIDRLQQIMDDVPPERNILIFNSGLRQVRLYFNGTYDCWFFIEIKRQVVRRSITYLTKARAMECYSFKKIIWIETVSTLSVTSSSDTSAEPPG